MKVSIITPTFGRPARLEPLVELWRNQTYPDKELLILDDSPEPSAFLKSLRDPSIRYRHSAVRMTIGAKRNELIRGARGEVIMHFDDDDYYAPGYIETMLGHLGGKDFVKLASWYAYDCRSRGLYFWDSALVLPTHYRLARGEDPSIIPLPRSLPDREDWLRRCLWGYGFSYVFRSAVFRSIQFDAALNKGEDYDFVERARRAAFRLETAADPTGTVVHVIHGTNTSHAFPNYRMDEGELRSRFGQRGADYLAAACGGT